MEAGELSDTEKAMLAFEDRWRRHTARKEEAIRNEFDLSRARYYQRLNALIDSPAALKHDAILVHRMQRKRAARATARADRVFTTSAA